MNRREVTKRMGAFLGGLFLTTHQPLELIRVGELLQQEELFSLCTATLPILWRLFFDGQLAEVSTLLPECLSHLLALASHASPWQKQAAGSASQANQLACMLALQEQRFGDAFLFARQGFRYGTLAEDPNLQAASLIRKALVYFYLKKPEQKLRAYQEALHYEARVSPLLRARIMMGLAEAHSHLVALDEVKHEREARHLLDVTYATFPAQPRDDPQFCYTHFKLPKVYGGLMHLALQEPEKAWDAFVQAEHEIPRTIVPDRVELLLHQTRALLALGELEESCVTLEATLVAAKTLHSPLRLQETREVYQQLYARWPKEQQVQDLAELFLT